MIRRFSGIFLCLFFSTRGMALCRGGFKSVVRLF